MRAEAGDGVGNEDAEATRRVADEATARDEARQLVRAAVDAALAEADAEEEAGGSQHPAHVQGVWFSAPWPEGSRPRSQP